MATTKIWDIKGRVDTLINYAANPEKTDGKLYSESEIKALHDVDEQAQEILDQFIKEAEKTAPDKATQQMAWVGHMNNARACAEEIIYNEIIYI